MRAKKPFRQRPVNPTSTVPDVPPLKAQSDAIKNEANDLFSNGKFIEAHAKYTEAIAVYENPPSTSQENTSEDDPVKEKENPDPVLYLNRGFASSKLDNHRDAISDYSVAYELFSNNCIYNEKERDGYIAKTLYRRMDSFTKLGETRKAVRDGLELSDLLNAKKLTVVDVKDADMKMQRLYRVLSNDDTLVDIPESLANSKTKEVMDGLFDTLRDGAENVESLPAFTDFVEHMRSDKQHADEFRKLNGFRRLFSKNLLAKPTRYTVFKVIHLVCFDKDIQNSYALLPYLNNLVPLVFADPKRDSAVTRQALNVLLSATTQDAVYWDFLVNTLTQQNFLCVASAMYNLSQRDDVKVRARCTINDSVLAFLKRNCRDMPRGLASLGWTRENLIRIAKKSRKETDDNLELAASSFELVREVVNYVSGLPGGVISGSGDWMHSVARYYMDRAEDDKTVKETRIFCMEALRALVLHDKKEYPFMRTFIQKALQDVKSPALSFREKLEVISVIGLMIGDRPKLMPFFEKQLATFDFDFAPLVAEFDHEKLGCDTDLYLWLLNVWSCSVKSWQSKRLSTEQVDLYAEAIVKGYKYTQAVFMGNNTDFEIAASNVSMVVFMYQDDLRLVKKLVEVGYFELILPLLEAMEKVEASHVVIMTINHIVEAYAPAKERVRQLKSIGYLKRLSDAVDTFMEMQMQGMFM